MKYHPLSGDNESPEDRRKNYIAIRCLGFVLITYLLVSTLITIIVDYSLGVENPVFQVESAAVYGLKVTDSYDLSATWNITLLATNPNKQLAIDFDKVRVLVYYGSKEDVLYAHDEDNYILAKKQLSSPFALLTGDETRLNFKFGVVGATIGDWMAMAISKEKKVSGSVKFGVWLFVEYRYRTDVWGKGETNFLNFHCEQGEFVFSPNTNDTGILSNKLRC